MYKNIFKVYISVNLNEQNIDMCNFNTIRTMLFKDMILSVIDEGIKKGELIKESSDLVEGLLAVEQGFLLMTWSEQRDIKEELIKFLNTLFDLIEIKNEI